MGRTRSLPAPALTSLVGWEEGTALQTDRETGSALGPPQCVVEVTTLLLLSMLSSLAVATLGMDAAWSWPAREAAFPCGAAWSNQRYSEKHHGQASGKPYVSLSVPLPKAVPGCFTRNLGRAPGQSDPDVYALIWNPQD